MLHVDLLNMYKIMLIVLLKIHHKLIKLEVEAKLLKWFQQSSGKAKKNASFKDFFPIHLSIKEAISLQPWVNVDL